MPISAQQRIAAYNAKYDAELIASRFLAVMAIALESAAEAFNALAIMEKAVQTILNRFNVFQLHRIKYYNFAREIWAAKRGGLAGPALFTFATSLSQKYQVLGCAPEILESIASNIFAVHISETTIPGLYLDEAAAVFFFISDL